MRGDNSDDDGYVTADEKIDTSKSIVASALPRLPELKRPTEVGRYLRLVERIFREEGEVNLEKTTVKLHVISFLKDETVRELAMTLVTLPWVDFRESLTRAFAHAAQLQLDLETRFAQLTYGDALFVNNVRGLYWLIQSSGETYSMSDHEFLQRLVSIIPPPVLTRLIERLDAAYPGTLWRSLPVNTILSVLEGVVIVSGEIAALTNASGVRRLGGQPTQRSDENHHGKPPMPLSEWAANFGFVLYTKGLKNAQLAILKKQALEHKRVNRRGQNTFFYLFAFKSADDAAKWTTGLPEGSFRPFEKRNFQ